jgi:hypothetical protein
MSITAIARQAQGKRAGEVIAKLAEDAYFMRVDNRVNQPPPARPRDNEATSRSANNGPNRTRAYLPAELNRRRSTAGGPPQRDNSNREVAPTALRPVAAVTTPTAAAATAEAPTTKPTGGLVAAAVAAAEATRTATLPALHRAGTMPARRLRSCGGRSRPPPATATASPPSHLDFATCSSPISSSLWGSPSTMRSRIPSSGSGATPSPSRTP